MTKQHIYIAPNGRKYIKANGTRKVYWSQQAIETLVKYYPTTSSADIADMLNMRVESVMAKARELSLKKDAEHRRRVNRATLKIANLHSRLYGNKGRVVAGQRLSPATEFKTRHILELVDTGFIGTSREIAELIGADMSNVVAAARREGSCKGYKIKFHQQ